MTPFLIENIDKFYDLTEIKQQDILDKILSYANDQPEKFVKIFHDIHFEKLNHHSIIYEALSKDLNNWSDFFLVEVKRLILKANNSKTPNKILDPIDAFLFINQESFKHHDEIIQIMMHELNNPNPTFRYYAIGLLSEWINPNDYKRINILKQHLDDPDWRIRYWTYLSLKNFDKLVNENRISWIDKIRAHFLDTLNFK